LTAAKGIQIVLALNIIQAVSLVEELLPAVGILDFCAELPAKSLSFSFGY